MSSTWAEALSRSLAQALDQLATAVRDCPDRLWETPMWETPPLPPDHQFLDANWAPVTDPGERASLAARWLERRSAPWSVAWHTLEALDYDLTGEFGPWAPPPPFAGHPHWRDLPRLDAAWSQAGVLGYIEHCRRRATETFAAMTDESAARPLPPAHRYHGQPHAWLLAGLPSHTAEHAAQIRQFIASNPASPGA